MTLRKFLIIAAVVCCVTLTTGVAWADSVPVLNSSFEITGAMSLSCGVGCSFNYGVPDWTISGNGGWFQPGNIFVSIPDGSTIGWLSNGSISQDLATGLSANTTYTLTVDVGNRPGYASAFTIALDAGGSQLCSFSGGSNSFTSGTFQAESCSFTTGSTVNSGNLSVILTKGTGGQFDFDNVSVTTNAVATPEPSSILLLGMGLIVVLTMLLASRQGIVASRA